MVTDFEEVFDSIMEYAERKLGRDDSVTQSELMQFVERSDNKKRISSGVLSSIISTGRAKQHIIENKDELRGRAINTELRRKHRSRRVDEAKTAKKVKVIRNKTFEDWKKDPSKYDLRGVDTQSHSLIRDHIRMKVQEAKEKGLKVIRRGQIDFYTVNKKGMYRNLFTGKYARRRRT